MASLHTEIKGMEELLQHWGIGRVDSIEPLTSFTGRVYQIHTADGQDFILKEKSGRSEAEREAALLLGLSKVGAPVALPVPTVAGGYMLLEAGKIFILYPRLPGEPFTEHYGGEASARAEGYGRAIAHLHGWLLKVRSPEEFPEMRLLEQIREWAIPRARKWEAHVNAGALEQVWAQVEIELKLLVAQLPHQLIHRDAHPGNMLFEGERLTGFLDFDLVVRGPRLFDLCYCGTSLLVAGFPAEEKLRAWLALFRALVRGYSAVNPLVPAEREAVYGMLVAIEMLFIAFSLEGGAEAAARCNESLVHWLAAKRAALLFPS